MAVIKRGEVAAPVVPKETVPVDALGGEVVVRGLLLSERLAVWEKIGSLKTDKANTQDSVSVHDILPTLLAICVLDADSLPVFDHDGWQAFGSTNANEAVKLFNVAWRLSGFALVDESKN